VRRRSWRPEPLVFPPAFLLVIMGLTLRSHDELAGYLATGVLVVLPKGRG
jgi:hypothetical protein